MSSQRQKYIIYVNPQCGSGLTSNGHEGRFIAKYQKTISNHRAIDPSC